MEGEWGLADRVPARLTTGEGRRFGLTVGGAFLVLAALLWWRGHPVGLRVAGGLGTALVLAGLVVPRRLGPVYAAWMKLALAISKVTTPVFMAIVYFVVLTPVGLLRRLLASRPAARESFWVPRAPGAGRASNLERQF